MKTILKHLSILAVSLLTTMTTSAEKIVLTPDNIANLSSGHYYIITTDIDLNGKSIVLPAEAVIEFEVGSFTGSGTININGAVIVADSYPIFGDDITVQGQFGNDNVMAGWFGTLDYRKAAQTINRALRSAPKNIIETGGNDCLINDTIFIDQDGQRLRCTGPVKVTHMSGNPDTGIAFDISANNVGLEVNSIESYYADSVKNFKPGTAIRIHGDVHNSQFNINKLTYFQRGIVIEPGYPNRAGEISDNVLKFQYLRAQRPLEVNLKQKNNTGEPSTGDTNRFACNRFIGGRLLGFYGLKYTSEGNSDIEGVSKYNVYDCIGFEKIDTMAIELKDSYYDRFVDLRMNEELPYKLRRIIKLSDTHNTYIMTKGGFISDYLAIGENCKDNIIDIPMTSGDALFYAPTRTIASSAVRYPGEDPVPGTIYEPLTTFDLGTYNVVKAIEYPDAATKTETTITLLDLMPQTHQYNGENQTGLGGICHIKIGKNRTIRLNAPNRTGSYLMPRADFDIVIDCADSGSLRVNNSAPITESGTYRLTLKRNIIAKGTENETDQWDVELIKVL